jgi:hypothetical protein
MQQINPGAVNRGHDECVYEIDQEPIMKALRFMLIAVAVLAGLASATPASAHGYYRGGVRGYWYGPSIGFYYGGPYGWGAPGYYGPGYGYGYVPPAYVYGPPGVVTSTGGVVYIERNDQVTTSQPVPPASASATPPAASPVPPPAGQWWYLCTSPRGAYPYVRECPGGWERVPAVPPGPVK